MAESSFKVSRPPVLEENKILSQYMNEYLKFCSWTHDLPDMYKTQLMPLLWPIFVHFYMDMMEKGYKEQANVFFSYFAIDHEKLNAVALKKLKGINYSQGIDSAQAFAHSSIRICQCSNQILLRYLQNKKFSMIVKIVEKYIEVLDDEEISDDDDVAAAAVTQATLPDASPTGARGFERFRTRIIYDSYMLVIPQIIGFLLILYLMFRGSHIPGGVTVVVLMTFIAYIYIQIALFPVIGRFRHHFRSYLGAPSRHRYWQWFGIVFLGYGMAGVSTTTTILIYTPIILLASSLIWLTHVEMLRLVDDLGIYGALWKGAAGSSMVLGHVCRTAEHANDYRCTVISFSLSTRFLYVLPSICILFALLHRWLGSDLPPRPNYIDP